MSFRMFKIAAFLMTTTGLSPAFAAGYLIEPIAFTGDAAPGLPGATFGNFGEVTINDGADSAFTANTGPCPPSTLCSATGAFAIGPPGRRLVINAGDLVPGIAGRSLGRPFDIDIDGSGNFALAGELNSLAVPNSSEDVVFRMGPGGNSLVARATDPLFGAGVWELRDALGDSGDVFFHRTLFSFDDIPWAVHRSSAGGPVKIVEIGDAAPGTSGAVLGQILFYEAADSGDAVVYAELEVGVGDTVFANSAGFFAFGPGGDRLIVRRGDILPGTGGAFVDDLGIDFALNSSGDLFFMASVKFPSDPTSKLSLLKSTAAGLSIVVRDGDPVPGAPGVAFDIGFGGLAINEDGDVAFQSDLSDGPAAEGLFVMPAGGAIRTVVRTGDQLDVAGTLRTVQSRLRINPEGFNSGGQLAFGASFGNDLHGLFLATEDGDNDGVVDTADICLGTAIPESAPTTGNLGPNRYALTVAGSTTFSKGPAAKTDYTTADTAGCSCEQIVDRLFLGAGHLKFGCAKGVMQIWINGLP